MKNELHLDIAGNIEGYPTNYIRDVINIIHRDKLLSVKQITNILKNMYISSNSHHAIIDEQEDIHYMITNEYICKIIQYLINREAILIDNPPPDIQKNFNLKISFRFLPAVEDMINLYSESDEIYVDSHTENCKCIWKYNKSIYEEKNFKSKIATFFNSNWDTIQSSIEHKIEFFNLYYICQTNDTILYPCYYTPIDLKHLKNTFSFLKKAQKITKELTKFHNDQEKKLCQKGKIISLIMSKIIYMYNNDKEETNILTILLKLNNDIRKKLLESNSITSTPDLEILSLFNDFCADIEKKIDTLDKFLPTKSDILYAAKHYYEKNETDLYTTKNLSLIIFFILFIEFTNFCKSQINNLTFISFKISLLYDLSYEEDL